MWGFQCMGGAVICELKWHRTISREFHSLKNFFILFICWIRLKEVAENKGKMHASINSNNVYALWQILQADNSEVIHTFLIQRFKHCTGASYIADGDRGKACNRCSGYVHQNFRSTLGYRYPFPGISSDRTLTVWNYLVQGYTWQHHLYTAALILS